MLLHMVIDQLAGMVADKVAGMVVSMAANRCAHQGDRGVGIVVRRRTKLDV